ncbi:MAG: AAA family ATPase [Deltaproteobacteria bacterium]|nr:AAA family ATPase [Deltaproteobacteria bacterium]
MTVQIGDYGELTEIHRSTSALVLRGVRIEDGRRVVLKTTPDRHPSPAQIARLVRERRLLAKAEGPRVVRLLAALDDGGAPVLVLDDIGGTSLDRVAPPASLEERLELAKEIARCVEAVHGRGVIHKDVNPANLVWNRSTATLEIVDFDLATDLKREAPSGERATLLEGTLRYVAPEQTGRMSSGIDRRSDLYSLGVTLFELFAGRPPFESDDPLDLVHAHLARSPQPLHELDDHVPPGLSAIVARLLEKAPERRYRTAAGLLADLERCAHELRTEGRVAVFDLGASDRTEALDPPRKLYGRAEATSALLDAFRRASSGGRELVLVSGAPGIGKTSLVHEVQAAIAERRGDLLEGKFDQFRLGVPYAPLGQAFGQLVRRVLTQPDSVVAEWRRALGEAVGRSGAVLVEMLPELELLLGPQEPVQSLAAAEAENRIHLVVRQLVQAIATEEHPVVLFLDDLQWADVPSLRLLERIVTNTDGRHLLVVGAYRDAEIDPAHPLAITLADVRRAGVTPISIELVPLAEAHVRALVRDTLGQTGPDVDELAAACTAKTAGNPFFLRRFLETLGDRNVVVYDSAARRWRWSLDAVAALSHTDNVVDLLVARLGELPRPALGALQQAACIGDVFDLRLLAESVGRSAAELQRDLAPAVEAELVAPSGQSWIFDDVDDARAVPEDAYHYRFVHDRIHQAVYRSMEEPAAREAHHQLGHLIARGHAEEDDGAWLLEVVNHLNRAASLATTDDERALLARRNLAAGRRAMRAAAFGPALDYLETGITALPADAWERHYALALALHAAAAESAYLNARFDLLEARIRTLEAHATSLLDRIEALEIEMEARMAQADLKGAVHLALRALEQLGSPLPEAPGDAEIGAAVQRTIEVLAGISADALERLPDVTDPRIAAVQRILVRACSPAYFGAPALLPIIACELVVISVREGLSTATPFGLGVLGIVLNAVGMMAKAHEVGTLAERLIDRWPDRRLEARTRLVINNNVCGWVEPLASRLHALREAYRTGRETGDLEYAAICAQSWATNSFSAGRELGKLLEDAEAFTGCMRNYEQNAILRLHQPLVQLVRAFVGQLPDPSRLDGPGFDEEAACAFAVSSGSASLAFVMLSDVLVARYHFGSAREAYEVAERARPYQQGAASTYHLATFHTYAPLAAARLFDVAPQDERPALLARLDESIAQLALWAEAGPVNHQHRLLVVQAERARVGGDVARSEELFLRAIEAARRTSYVNDEALISELAARMHLARGGVHASIGRAFLEDATFCYQRWGATQKVERLREEFPRLLGAASARRSESTRAAFGSSSGLDIDAAAVVRAARTLSAEIELDKLLTTLFRTVLAAGGARKATLLLERAGHWEVAIEGAASGEPTLGHRDEAVVRHSLSRRPIDDLDPAEHPLAVLRYVLRTGETVLIDDAAEPGSLMDADAYGKTHGARSVLCLPVRHRGALLAVLYLEHDQAAGVFAEARSGLIDLLMSQAAVSIHNAQLFDAQVRLTTAQSRFVPHQFLESLEHHDIAEVALGDAVSRTMSVFFSDLRDFTALAESMEATAVIRLLNDYFAAMEPSIADAGGFIDSFNGDEIMALFDGEPEQAVRAGIHMQAALERFNARYGRSLRMGIGINTGPVVLGTVGGRDRIKCGVVGDAVNVASRIEGLTKRYGARLLIGEQTHAALDPRVLSLRPVDRVAVKGARRAQTLYEVLDAAAPDERAAKERSRAALEEAMARYQARDFRGASAAFARCRDAAPTDRVPAIFLERCRQLEASPPPEGWEGVDRLG